MSGPPDVPAGFSGRVIAWHREHGRHDLPWQGRDPYRVWLSEVMLQQTQVATALPYFQRFVARCPDLDALAAASLDEVLALWSGLGYYSRARNLHRAAREIRDVHGGRFPTTCAELATLPGIGRSTAAAIAAFCFGERAAILDGNVKRVLARVLAFEADLAGGAALRSLWGAATALLPDDGIEAYTQGLMDLGATLCTSRAPRCPACPLRELCKAAASGEPERFPAKSRRLVRSRRENAWLDLRWRDRVWLLQRGSGGVWAGLWSLPEFASLEALDAVTAGWPGEGRVLPSFTHVLTHLDWTLHPVRWTVPAPASPLAIAELSSRWPEGRWFDLDDALRLGLPAPLRKRLEA